jgi:cobalt-zinc-cadmium efflux system membrane fusion protein
VREDANVFLISDLSSVWAEIIVSPKDLHSPCGREGRGARHRLRLQASGTVAYVGA